MQGHLKKDLRTLTPFIYCIRIFLDFSLTVKAAPHECVIRTGQP